MGRETTTMSNSSLVDYVRISPNRTRPRKNKIDRITLHHMAGNLSVETCGSVFASSSRQASSNYSVASDGRVGMYVEEKDRSWCSSSSSNDHRAVTIEVADDVIGNGWHSSDKAMKKLVELCADICRRNGIPKLRYTGDTSGNLTMHKWFVPTDCPGRYLESKFKWIAEQVNNLLSGGNYKPPANTGSVVYDPMSKGYLVYGDTGTSVRKMQTMLIKCGFSCGSSGADGSFGSDTLKAVKSFQSKMGLSVDGSYGSATQKALNSLYTGKNTSSKIKLTVDGSFGSATVKRTQQYFGTTMDGKISNQPLSNKKYLASAYSGAWNFLESGYGAGSDVVRAMQRMFGVTSDGWFGKKSVIAMQKFLGVTQDGSMGAKTTTAWQKWLNSH